MNDGIGQFPAWLILIAAGAFFLAAAAYQLIIGQAGAKMGVADRNEQPVYFWLVIAICAGAGIYSMSLGLSLLF